MKTVAKPRVFISYTWRPDDSSNPSDKPQARGLELADRLRAAGLDSRIDQYFLRPRHGFEKPYRRPGDKVEPWVLWAGAQIQEADFVLLMCSAQYSATVCKSPLWDDSTLQQWPDVPDELKFKLQEPDLRCEHWRAMPDDLKFKLQEYQLDESKGKKNKVPYTWWDWHFMIQDMESGRAEKQKFIPVGFLPYSSVSHYVPYFIKGESYCNLDSDEDFEGLLRGMKTQFRIRHPREGIFVSYSHEDKKLFDEFLTMMAPAIQRGVVDIWDDTKIAIGAKWKEEIQNALASAKVAVLLVSQNFLKSQFITDHELRELLRAAEEEGVTVFWIYLSSCLYEQTEIAKYQAAHDVARPLDQRTKSQRQAIWSEVCTKLVRLAAASSRPIKC
jgi:hypothetical protein